MNIVKMIGEQLGDEAIGSMASLLGVDANAARKATSAAVPALLAGLGQLASREDGAKKLASTMQGMDLGRLASLSNLLGGKPTETIDHGTSMLDSLLGKALTAGLGTALAKYVGIDSKVVSRLLGLISPWVIGMIGKQLGGQLNASSLMRLFADQKSSIAAAVPAGFNLTAIPGLDSFAALGDAAAKTGHAASAAVGSAGRRAEAVEKGIMPWLLPLLAIALLGFLGWYFFLRPQAATQNAIEEKPSISIPQTPDVTAVTGDVTSAFELLTRTLNGITDEASAETALPELRTLETTIGSWENVIANVPAAGQDSLRALIKSNLAKAEAVAEQKMQIPGVGDLLRSVVEGIFNALRALIG